MKDSLLLGLWRHLIPVPRGIWQRQIEGSGEHTEANLGFMSEEHHLIRNFVVRELPRVGKPLTSQFIAQKLNMDVRQVTSILDDLENHMTFLFRGDGKAVTWAYPVTTDVTPHRVTLSTGEQVHAA